MKRYLLIGVLLIGCSKEDKKPQEISMRPLIPDQIRQGKSVYVLTAGQSNMTLRDANGTQGVPTYFCEDVRIVCKAVNLAVGGSSQQEWIPGSFYYNNLLNQAKTLPRIDILLWWQGEAEGVSGDMAKASQWGQNFTLMIQSIRNSLGKPDLFVIFCQIGANPAGDHEGGNGVYTAWEEVKRQQASIYLSNVYMVKTDDQEFFGWVHTNEAGYRAVAQRIMQVYLTNN